MTNPMIEAAARAICEGMGLRSWDDVPADRGDLRARIRSGGNYDVNEPHRMDYTDGAEAAITAIEPMIRADERAQVEREIVEWLRGDGDSDWFDPDCADAIEAGEYRK